MKRLFGVLLRLEEWTLTMTLLGLAGIAFVQVFFRYVLNISFPWFEELGRYLGVFITFLGASLGVKYGVHFSMDLVVTHLPRRLSHLVQAATNLTCLSLFAAVVYYSVVLCARMRGYETTTPTMELPMWWAYAPIPFFSAIMVWRFGVKAWDQLKAMSAGSEVEA